jgi:hypothetical protein
MLRRLLLSSLIILATVKLLNAQPPGSFGRMRVEFETPQHIICDTGCSGSAATGDLLGTYGPTTFTSNDQFLGPVTVPTGTRTILISTMTQNYNGRLALEANSGDGGFSLGTTFLAVKEVSSENARSFSNSTQVMFWSGGATYGRLFYAIDLSPQIF